MSGSISEKDKIELEIARQNRKFEISLFWQRANYFLVLNTALAVGAYSVSGFLLRIFLCILGTLVSVLWFRTNIGAKFWQSFWEHELAKLAEKNDFKAMCESEETIRTNALSWAVESDSPWHKKYVHRKMTTLKPEVSHNMILLSLIAIWAWAILAAFQILLSIVVNFPEICSFFARFQS